MAIVNWKVLASTFQHNFKIKKMLNIGQDMPQNEFIGIIKTITEVNSLPDGVMVETL